jgi:hypothetical protein
VAGTLRFFADRFGVPRASIEGTTLSYDLVREHASLGPPRVVLTGPRKHQGLAVERRRSYFGFDLDTEVEALRGKISAPLLAAARDTLAEALIAGETIHPDQGRLNRALAVLDELWRRSGGVLSAIAPSARRALIRAQLETVDSWDGLLSTRLAVDPELLVDEPTRQRLDALPDMVRVRGDAVPLDYELADGAGIARVRLREGQAKRLRPGDLPPLDRPLRFAVMRGRHHPILADTIEELHVAIARAPRAATHEDDEGRPHRGRGHPRGGGQRGGRGGPRGSRGPRGADPRHRSGRGR